MVTEKMYEKLAQLVVRKGVNVQKDQPLIIRQRAAKPDAAGRRLRRNLRPVDAEQVRRLPVGHPIRVLDGLQQSSDRSVCA